ncbi:hypothetical protein ACQYZY_28970 [Pseudomonas aeruginosa]|uniref:hypothetical protein n=1 Tax=Pseudomonas aeruginosa TaxID=287 RepID=UPI003D2DDD2C
MMITKNGFLRWPLLIAAMFSALPAMADTSSDDTPWTRRMADATDLFGVKLDGKAVTSTGTGFNPKGFDTFAPFQDNQQNMVQAYGATEVGVGCNGLNLGTVLDGQIAQYGAMVEQFISDAPALAIMYLAYSQPTVKAVIDELNVVGQFGLDLSNMTCSGVRQLADKSYEEKKQVLAEADCTTEAGYKSSECMAGEGLTGSLIKGAQEMKAKATSRAGALMGTVSNATGGLVGVKGSSNGTGGTGGQDGAAGNGNALTPTKHCSGVSTEGTTALLLAASEMSCDDIKDYGGLLPSYSTEEGATTVTPRTETIEVVAKKMTKEYVDLYKDVYRSSAKNFQDSDAYKQLVNRAEIVITDNEFKFMRTLASSNPAVFENTQRNLASLATLKELETLVAKLELGVLTGLSNQAESELISNDVIKRYHLSAEALRKELEIMKARINADRERNDLLQATYRSVR